MNHPPPASGVSPARQVALIIAVAFRTSFRKGFRLRLLYYLTLFFVVGPLAILVGFLAANAAAAKTYWPGDVLFLGIFAAAFFFKGLLASEVVDVPKLFFYPVRHGTVFAAALLGQALAPSLAVFIALFLGYSLAANGPAPAIALRAVVVLVFLALLHHLVLLLQLLLSNLLRKRRWRDLSTIAGSLFAAGLYILTQVARSPRFQAAVEPLLDAAAPLLAALPSTWAARALHPGTPAPQALLYFASLTAVTAALAWTAVHLQRLAFYGEISFSGGRAARGPIRLGRAWRWRLPVTEVGAVAAKDLQTLRRDPLIKDLLIRQVGFVVVPLGALFLGTRAPRHPAAVVSLLTYTLLLGETPLLLNLFSLDDRGVAALFATPAARWKILLGKDVANLLLFAPINAGFCAAALLFLGAPGHIPFAAALGTASVAAALAVGNFASAVMPYPLLARRRTALGSEARLPGGCLGFLPRLLLLPAALLLSSPVAFFVGLPLVLEGPWTYALSLPAAAVFSIALIAASLPAAARLVERREERLITTFAWKRE